MWRRMLKPTFKIQNGQTIICLNSSIYLSLQSARYDISAFNYLIIQNYRVQTNELLNPQIIKHNYLITHLFLTYAKNPFYHTILFYSFCQIRIKLLLRLRVVLFARQQGF